MKVLSVSVSRFKRRMEKKLGEREVPKSFFVLGFGDVFRVILGRLMNLKRRKEPPPPSPAPPPGKNLLEYVQNCDILD